MNEFVVTHSKSVQYSSAAHSGRDYPVIAERGGRVVLSPMLLSQRPTETQHLTVVSIDNSMSMYDTGAVVALEQQLPKFIHDLNRDPSIRSSVLMTFACFGDQQAFAPLGPVRRVSDLTPPQLHPSPLGTPLCERLVADIAYIIAARKMLRNQLNVSQRKSCLIEFTDGEATDKQHEEAARQAVQRVAAESGIDVFLFGVGAGADMRFLHSIEQPERPAELLTSEKNFADLFRWLSNSLRIVSQTNPGKSTEILSVNGKRIRTQ